MSTGTSAPSRSPSGDGAQEKAEEIGGQAQDRAQQISGQAQDKAQELAGQAQEKAQEAASQAKGKLREQLDQRSSQAAEQINEQASDLRAVEQSLREQGKEGPANAADRLAQYVEKVGGYLRDKDTDGLLNDAEDLARRQPWAVGAGALALGFAAARFLKASSRQRYSSRFNGSPSGAPTASDRPASGLGGAPSGGQPPMPIPTPPGPAPASRPPAAAPATPPPGVIPPAGG